MTFFKMRPAFLAWSRSGLALLALAAAAGTTGCGGVSGNNAATRIRVVDAAVNAGTANIIINGASANGDQQPLVQTSVSPYLYLSGDRASTFSYNTTVVLPTTTLTQTVPTLTLNNGQFYTAFLIGRADVEPIVKPGTKTINDPRLVQVVVTQDRHDSPASGSALVRVVDAAPDGGVVDVAVNGATLSGYGNVIFQEPTSDFLAAPYVNVPAGNVSVQVNKTGTTTPLFSPVSVSVSAGQVYTLVITEPVAGAAATTTTAATSSTFGLQTISDNG